MSDKYFFGKTRIISQVEREIRHLFDHHVNTLFQQKWTIIDQITQWSNTLIRHIQEHVNEQRKCLDQVYETKLLNLNVLRDRFIEQSLFCEQKQEIEQVRQNLNQCNTLKFELATLIYLNRPIQTIQLVLDKQSIKPNQYMTQSSDKQTGKQLIEHHENGSIYDVNKNASPSINREPTK